MMKKLIAGFALVATLGVGAIVGIAPKHEAVEPAQASAGSASGTMTVAMKPGCWDSGDKCKMAVYFFDDNYGQKGWSNLVTYHSGVRVANLSYNLDFVPEKMIVVRYNYFFNEADWVNDRWGEHPGDYGWQDSPKWNQTGNLDYVANADLLINTAEGGCEVRTSAYIKGRSTATSGNWEKLADLENLKVNYDNNFEYFGEITVLPNEEFKVYSNNIYCDGFDKVTFDPHVDSSKWEDGENHNIVYVGTEQLRVSIYYDIGDGSIYIGDCYEHAISVDSPAFFTNWDDVNNSVGLPGNFKAAGAEYDRGSFNAFGSFFDGCTGVESRVYTLKSIKWKQYTPYIYFQWGGAKDYKDQGTFADNEVEKLVFHFYANENDTTPVVSKDLFNNAFVGLTMHTRNYRIPDDVLSQLSSEFYMSVDLFDGRGYEYGAHIFGNLHVNQTHEEVSEAQWYYLKHCQPTGSYAGKGEGWDSISVNTLRNHYATNESLRSGFVFETGFEEQFDTQASFENNFMLDYANGGGADLHEDKAISFASYRGWADGSKMPFNKTGDGFFKGWFGEAAEDSENRGYSNTDGWEYRFVSRPFRLPANGIVSIKMAGTGSLHLIDFDGGHDILAWVNCRTFNTEGDENNIAWSGKSVCTMVRHVVNFSKYAGRLVQIGFADISTGGWGTAYFDEIKANYSALPSLQVDLVPQYKDTTSYSAIRDVYVTSVQSQGGVVYQNASDSPESDTSALNAAAGIVTRYLNAVRRHTETYNENVDPYQHACECNSLFCEEYQSQTIKDLLADYNNLSEAAKKLVCDSDDYRRVGATKDNWATTSIEKLNLGDSLDYLGRANGVVVNTSYRIFGNTLGNSEIIIIMVMSLFAITACGAFFTIHKRKQR